ncbi:MAG: FKBP-type peptidyl-prolyl cis-trans isomerase [Verrucomicrobia bacterium]|nr:FKBP-type peptidyl-prolyl cis-trans isomerase [Verrucomicrobiota bacterium]
MKRALIATVAAGLLVAQGQAQDKPASAAPDNKVLKDPKDKISYSIGLNIGNNVKQQGLDLNPEILAAGVKDALSGGKPLLTDEQVRETLTNLQKDLMSQRAVQSENNKKAGAAFLVDNKKQKGTQTLPSGLQYQVIKEGKGKKPKSTDIVKTHYRGTLIDGKEFDSSIARGEPETFPLTEVIAGWTEALQLMPVGSKWKLFVPSNLAYGEQGQGPIPPNSTLIFEIELLGIEESPKK